jgi:HEAT repeat protein
VATLAQLFERARERWRLPVESFSGQAQRFGTQAWQRITARWPALDQFILAPTGTAADRVVQAPLRALQLAAARGKPLTTSSVESLIADLRDGDSWQNRVRGATGLGKSNADGVMDALLGALRDASAEVAVAVVDALAQQSDPRALKSLRNVLANPDGYFSPITRVAALSRLAERLPIVQFDPILAALRDVDAEVSIAAIAAIVDRLPRHAAAQFVPIVRNESGFFLPVVRLAAAGALERAAALSAREASELLRLEQDGAVGAVLRRIAEHRASA